MEVTCRECGAVLRLNPQLLDVQTDCPRCGARIPPQAFEGNKGSEAPKSRRKRGRDKPEEEASAPKAKSKSKSKAPPEPAPEPELEPAAETRPVAEAPSEPAEPRRPEPYSFYLFCAQTLLALLAFSCFAGAIWGDTWKPPVWSYFVQKPVVLLSAGVLFCFYTYMARRLPILITLVAALSVLAVCALNYHLHAMVDVSRVLALSVAFLSLWCALEHRRFVG